MIRIKFTGKYQEDLSELCYEHPLVKEEIDNRVKLFLNNPEDTRLDNHALTGRMAGNWAFSITNDIRIVYEWLGKKTVRFLAIGGHPKVYP